MGEHSVFELHHPPDTNGSSAVLYDVWLAGDVPRVANEAAVTVNRAYGQAIRTRCLAAGSIYIRARGPEGDYLSKSFRCVACDDEPPEPSP